MEVKDIAEYEENDSQLAKYTIQKLHSIINEAREYIKKNNLIIELLQNEKVKQELLEILDKENE